RDTPSTMMMGSTLATPGTISPVCRPVVLVGAAVFGSLLDKGQLLLIAEDALWSEYHDQHERDPDEDVAEHRGLDVGERQDVVLRELGQHIVEERHEHPEDHSSHDGAEQGSGATEQQDCPKEEREARDKVGRHHR